MPGFIYVHCPAEQISFPFQPSISQRQSLPLFHKNSTPRYLYRLVAPQAPGTSPPSNSAPFAVCRHPPDLFQFPPKKAANLLLNHLLWQRGAEDGCNLLSWTSSLLFALQYALYRHRKDGDDLRHITLIIIDTSLFPQGTFIQDMEVMKLFEHADTRLHKFVEYRETEYYFGEYLTQGPLNIQGRCVFASVQQMIDLGLFTLQPGLADVEQWQCWPKRVLDYRQLFADKKQVATRKGDVTTAFDIARHCFGGPWTVPGAIMLLSLQPRYKDDRVIADGFKAQFTAAEIKEAALHKVETHTTRLPEVGQFRDLVEFIKRSYGLSEYDTVVNGVKDLSVSEQSD
ncbi:hypothetical protein ASPCAL01627 [Aspergillus calidoustus]|uniref:DUF7587 domain-containing protein n=1 Tax=Aspergillus calidoustus TaxID=454130 RepID=A0A0U5GMQ7_ASPCI|nr:hypothetical protein ASPCAL01627 [Aspergillus calidoustus]